MSALGQRDFSQIAVLVTRPRVSEDDALVQLLSGKGFSVTWVPLTTVEPLCEASLLKEVKAIRQSDILVFTSANGVRCFYKLLDSRPPSNRVAALGVSTKRAARAFGFRVDTSIDAENSDSLFEALLKIIPTNQKLILCQAKRPHGKLSEQLEKEGYEVQQLPVYNNAIAKLSGPEFEVLTSWGSDSNQIKFLTFASPLAVTSFIRCRSECSGSGSIFGLDVVVIGRTTERAARDAGFKQVFRAEHSTVESLGMRVVDCALARLGQVC